MFTGFEEVRRRFGRLSNDAKNLLVYFTYRRILNGLGNGESGRIAVHSRGVRVASRFYSVRDVRF